MPNPIRTGLNLEYVYEAHHLMLKPQKNDVDLVPVN